MARRRTTVEAEEKRIIKRLKEFSGSIWLGDSSGSGSSGTIYMIGDDGLYTAGSMSEALWVGCYMTKEDFEEAKVIISKCGNGYSN